MAETIAALATARGKSAVAVLRLSGDKAFEIAEKVFSPMPKQARTFVKGKFYAEYFTDSAMCVRFDAPKSYTGENCVEFYLHGGVAIAEGAVAACIENGARLAMNGEFSKRAFLNGKMTLDGCEGVIEMIEAESAAAVRSGYSLLTGRLSSEVSLMQDELKELIARVEVALDYPEEDLELITKDEVSEALKSICERVDYLLERTKLAPVIKSGANIAIIGKVNAGKSSLLNALLASDRAIVSDEEGTTRDIVEASLNYKDMRFNFFDTAGLRDTENKIEAEGIRRAEKLANQCDLILFVTQDENEEYTSETGIPVIKVLNKCDINSFSDTQAVRVSALTGEGIKELKEIVYGHFMKSGSNADALIITNARQIDCLKRISVAVRQALEASEMATVDCAAQFLYTAWNTMGEITGNTTAEDIVDCIFSRFCLGK